MCQPSEVITSRPRIQVASAVRRPEDGNVHGDINFSLHFIDSPHSRMNDVDSTVNRFLLLPRVAAAAAAGAFAATAAAA
jgi:hypothetical protein